MRRKKYVFTKARKKALLKARKKWKTMKPKKRRMAMPPRRFKGKTEAQIRKALERRGKRYVPIGGYIALDVGRKKHHYIFAKKTRYGWKRAKPPKGVKTVTFKGKKLVPYTELKKHMAKVRKGWTGLTTRQRKLRMPERKGKKGYKPVKKTVMRRGEKVRTTLWKKTK